MFDWIPNLHPIVVHFPIGVLIAAVIADIIILGLKRPLDHVVNWLYAGGTLGLVAAFLSGRAAVDSLLIPAAAQAIQTDHADWATVTMWFFIVFTLARIALTAFPLKGRNLVRAASVISGIVGIGLLTITGDLGGRMVFGHGVGVATADPTEGIEGEDMAKRVDPASATAALGYALSAVEGDLTNAVLGTDSSVVNLFLDRDDLTMVTDQRYGSVQVDVDVNLDRFRGSAAVLYGFVSPDQNDYVELGQGTVEQGRVTSGQTNTFDTAVLSPSGWITLTTVSDDTHFRGYVDGKMVVHGHGDAAAEGAVGFKFDGSGLVQMRDLRITSLR